MPQGRPTGAAFRAREFRRSASLFIGSAKGSNRQFGTTARRDAPRGNAPARLDTCMEKETMPKFVQMTLHRHARAQPSEGRRRYARLCRGHPRLGAKVRRGRTLVQHKQRDCFAEPVIGPAKGRTRWLAMTWMVRWMPSLRGARSATKQSPLRAWTVAVWRNEPERVDQEGIVVGVRLRQGFGGHPPREVLPAEALA
jgi:hypothetical protein